MGNSNGKDSNGHGTNCAGIVAANPSDDMLITGVAPKVNLMVVKISEDGSFIGDNFIKGFTWLVQNQSIDVINLSFEVSSKNTQSKLTNLINKLSDSCVIVSACRDNDKLFKTYLSFPASESKVLSVGALNAESFNKNVQKGNAINPQIDYILGFESRTTCGIEDPNDVGVHVMLAAVGHGQGLRESLGFIVDPARTDRVDMAPVGFRLRMHLGIPIHFGG